MGGYGLYVWGSYVVTLICIVGEILLISRRHRTLEKQYSLIYGINKEEIKNETTS
ncbi:heme exporter protein CcmD [Nitrosomonas sp. Is24]|nr:MULTISPECIES: heme exporter protein CcmD [Nitrosomonas]MDV6341408.1 heme exporter protein CcmD [Nitrosomonas sp. Is24]